ncbi:MAG: hypothetical protein ACK47C_00595 [Paracoccaceae bacterium]
MNQDQERLVDWNGIQVLRNQHKASETVDHRPLTTIKARFDRLFDVLRHGHGGHLTRFAGEGGFQNSDGVNRIISARAALCASDRQHARDQKRLVSLRPIGCCEILTGVSHRLPKLQPVPKLDFDDIGFVNILDQSAVLIATFPGRGHQGLVSLDDLNSAAQLDRSDFSAPGMNFLTG